LAAVAVQILELVEEMPMQAVLAVVECATFLYVTLEQMVMRLKVIKAELIQLLRPQAAGALAVAVVAL
jgi:hypothetical protein